MIQLTTPLRWIGVALYRVGLHRAVIRWRKRRVRVLLYHACEERESDFTVGLRSNTTPREFAVHLDFYARHYQVIPFARVVAGDVPDCAAVITFDDGYRSVFEHAAPLLRARKMSATVFLVTRVVGNGGLVWVNELNWLLRQHSATARPVVARVAGLPESAAPEEMIEGVRQRYDAAAIEAALREIRAAAGVDGARVATSASLYMTWDDVRSMQREGFTFGNHTATHPSLSSVAAAVQLEEIAEAQRTLKAEGCNGRWLAYPFGDHNAESREVAIELGCEAVFAVGVRSGSLDRFDIGRSPVHASDDANLFAQLEIVEPVKAWLRGVLRIS